jgi:hypothetical protein
MSDMEQYFENIMMPVEMIRVPCAEMVAPWNIPYGPSCPTCGEKLMGHRRDGRIEAYSCFSRCAGIWTPEELGVAEVRK